ncbi:hypothetical protein VNI00_004838 [Paramarasmius palmivorus]|uniref:Uncharacterized protein n=1 Tax=Paramarasmius palmivorus TaxID=297713 RepID=A0AAW0DJ59_9AGAR
MSTDTTPSAVGSFELPRCILPIWMYSRDEDKCQDYPQVPPELSAKRCAWGYEINDENFLAYETEYPESTVSPLPDTTRRIALIRQISQELGIQHEPKTAVLYGKDDDRYFVYWAHNPSYATLMKPTVPCEELLEKFRETMRFKVKEQWFVLSRRS